MDGLVLQRKDSVFLEDAQFFGLFSLPELSAGGLPHLSAEQDAWSLWTLSANSGPEKTPKKVRRILANPKRNFYLCVRKK
ncbi:hypothetical protein [uncultured Alistipes sp.]|uniref:hypothetical protein n=1 Tax=uncultured Alistipes sp. TaxID=538949 RepID=UPI002803E860|nr:hypothetical protein [uncultured Alistipes sp.]